MSNDKKNKEAEKKKLLLVVLVNLFFLILVFGLGEFFLRISVDFKKKSIPAGEASIFLGSETNSWEHKPNTRDFSAGHEIYINNLGFRDNDFTFRDNEKNMILLGDSFTFGNRFPREKIFSELLEKRLNEKNPKWNVINAGHVGQTTDNHYLTLKKHYEAIKPQKVILNFFVGNDITELRRHEWIEKNGDLVRVKDKKIFVDENSRLRTLESEVPRSYFLNFLGNRIKILKAHLGIKEAKEPTLTWPVFLEEENVGYDPRLPQFWSMTEKVLEMIKKFSQEKDFELKVVIIPMDVQVSKFYWKKYPAMLFDENAFLQKRPQKKMAQICREKNLDCLDLLPIFQASPDRDRLYFSNADPHFDEAGHVLMSEVLARENF